MEETTADGHALERRVTFGRGGNILFDKIPYRPAIFVLNWHFPALEAYMKVAKSSE